MEICPSKKPRSEFTVFTAYHYYCQTITTARPLLLPDHYYCQTITTDRPLLLPDHYYCQTITTARPLLLPDHYYCQTITTARPLLSLCLSHRHGLVPLPGSPAVEAIAITTTTNTAYEVMKQGGGQEGDHEYELVSSPGGPPHAKDLEGAYEIPSLPTPHQPLPAVPPPGSVGGAEEEAVYEHIPGDQ